MGRAMLVVDQFTLLGGAAGPPSSFIRPPLKMPNGTKHSSLRSAYKASPSPPGGSRACAARVELVNDGQ